MCNGKGNFSQRRKERREKHRAISEGSGVEKVMNYVPVILSEAKNLLL
jgi:hypothetical protein